MTEPSRRLTERENGAETPQRSGLGLNRNNDSGLRIQGPRSNKILDKVSPSLSVSICKMDLSSTNIINQKRQADTYASTRAPCGTLLLSALIRSLYATLPNADE